MIVRWLVALVAIALAVSGAVATLGQAGSGAQPWDEELSDNFVFVKVIPFALALGLALGIALGGPRRADASRRFAPATILLTTAPTFHNFCRSVPTSAFATSGIAAVASRCSTTNA